MSEFTCALCGRIHPLTGVKRPFPTTPDEHCVSICGKCFGWMFLPNGSIDPGHSGLLPPWTVEGRTFATIFKEMGW